jgi:hypothetical protein
MIPLIQRESCSSSVVLNVFNVINKLDVFELYVKMRALLAVGVLAGVLRVGIVQAFDFLLGLPAEKDDGAEESQLEGQERHQ